MACKIQLWGLWSVTCRAEHGPEKIPCDYCHIRLLLTGKEFSKKAIQERLKHHRFVLVGKGTYFDAYEEALAEAPPS